MTRITQNWVQAPATKRVMKALGDAGFEAFFVGGCVRNALMNIPVTDIDIATSALPDETVEAARNAGLKAVPTGAEHGTITLISDGVAHEVTTYRADVETDGRHATVRFSADMSEDAARRDFTMNALYAAADGEVRDPLGGLDDLLARRVRFIGDAQARIREDYLRILRFFRFFAWYGDQALGVDADGLAAVAGNLDGLAGLSRERVGSEIKKLLAAPDPSMAVAAMQASGTLAQVLPGADARALGPLVHLEQSLHCKTDPILRLAALAWADVTETLRLSKKEAKRLDIYREEASGTKGPAHLAYLHGAQIACGCVLLRAALLEQALPGDVELQIDRGAAAEFPLRGKDLAGRYKGPELGAALKEREARWIESGFALGRDELLS